MLVVTLLCFVTNGTKQSGSLLYSNVAHLTPEHLRAAPGFAEAHEEYFARLRTELAVVPMSIPRERKQLAKFADDYLDRHEGVARSSEKLCGKLAKETCLRNLFRLPALALAKFRYSLTGATAGDFGPDQVYRKQLSALTKGSAEEDS